MAAVSTRWLPWENSRIARDLAAEVKTLREGPGRDVLLANSASVIGELLRLDLIDDLRLFVVPVLVGGGIRLFPDNVDARFTTAGVAALANGVVGLHLTRPRPSTGQPLDCALRHSCSRRSRGG